MRKTCLLLSSLLLLCTGCAAPAEQAGVGVIGGADGPTVIIVSGSPEGWITLIAVLALIVVGAVWLIRRKRK